MLSTRQTDIISQCLTPKTIDEIAAHYNCSYHTARNDVLLLQEQGFLRKSLYPKNRKYSYQTVYKTETTGGIEHLNFQFRGNSYSPVGIMKDNNILVGATRATRLIQLSIAKLLFEYDGAQGTNKKESEEQVPRSQMVKARVLLAAEYLREVADLAEQVAECVIWDKHEFIRLFYGPQGYDREVVEKMQEELTNEAEKWPEFNKFLESLTGTKLT